MQHANNLQGYLVGPEGFLVVFMNFSLLFCFVYISIQFQGPRSQFCKFPVPKTTSVPSSAKKIDPGGVFVLQIFDRLGI